MEINIAEIFSILIFQLFMQAPIFLGTIALIGLLLQRKKAEDILEGTVKTIVGMMILNAGVGVFLGGIIPLTNLFNQALGVVGVLPDCFGPFGIVLPYLATEMSLVFIGGFLLHLLIVRIIPWKNWKNVYLTGHIMLWYVLVFIMGLQSTLGLTGVPLIIGASICCAVNYTVLCAMARPFTKEMTDDKFTLGHLNTLAIWFGHYAGKLFKGTTKSEEIKLPGVFARLTDYTILLSVIMPVFYVVIGAAAGAEAVQALAGETNWVVWLITNGLTFAAGIAIVLFGVRMFLASMVPAFKGISDKILPGTVPGLDCPVFYPYSMVAAIIGFLFDFLGSLLGTFILIAVASPIVVLPGPIFFFFSGALAGPFGDREGGWKGAALAGFITGLWLTLGTLLLYPFMGLLFDLNVGLTFSGEDMILLIPFFYILKLIGGR